MLGVIQDMRYVLGVFARPVARDWAFWHAVAWTVALGVTSYLDPEGLENSSGPLWLNAAGVGLVSFFFIGWPVAGVRRIFRMFRARRSPPEATSSNAPREAASSDPISLGLKDTADSAMVHPSPQADSPIPLSSYAGVGLRDHEVLTNARQTFPYPVARAVRAVQTTQDPLEQYQHMLDLGEALTLTVGMLSASWLRTYSPSNEALRLLYDAYHLRGVSQGHWHEVTKAAEQAMVVSPKKLPGFLAGIGKKKGRSDLLGELKIILAERNRAAHGARPHNRAEAAVRTQDLEPSVTAAVGLADFLAQAPWILVEGVSLRRQDRRWNVRLRKAMGDHPDFDAASDVLDHPLANDTFYVMSGPEPLDLTPMLVLRYCEVCRQPEVCHADRVDERFGVCLKSFARGHEVFDRELVADVSTLVAGYKEHG